MKEATKFIENLYEKRNKWNDGSLQCGFGASTPEKEAIICGRKV
jgi:hypothetical protein